MSAPGPAQGNDVDPLPSSGLRGTVDLLNRNPEDRVWLARSGLQSESCTGRVGRSSYQSHVCGCILKLVDRRLAPFRTVLWAVVLPAATAVSAGVGVVLTLTDSEYTLAAILATYAVLMPGVALRNSRALGLHFPNSHRHDN